MNNKRHIASFAAFGLLMATAVAPSAWGHHAFAAEFDAKKPVHFEGVVSKVELINPHSWIHVDVTDASGKVTTWMIEAGSPNVLLRRGINKNTIPTGTKVIVDGFQSKDGSMRANGRDVTLPDGKRLFLGSSGTGAPYDEKK
ncbi:MAG TPA: DUF6152 family protein [Bryobacteraceae bacterium]